LTQNAANPDNGILPELYSSLYAVICSIQHFDYYDVSLAYCDIETGFEESDNSAFAMLKELFPRMDTNSLPPHRETFIQMMPK